MQDASNVERAAAFWSTLYALGVQYVLLLVGTTHSHDTSQSKMSFQAAEREHGRFHCEKQLAHSAVVDGSSLLFGDFRRASQ